MCEVLNFIKKFPRENNGPITHTIIGEGSFNLSQENIQIELNSENLKGIYTSFFTGDEKVFQENENIDLYPWEFQIYSNKK